MNSDFTAQDGQGGRERELLRQKLLLGSLVLDRAPSALRGWLKTPPARPQPDRDPAHRAWQVYRANAHAGAARALATAFPTVRALMGELDQLTRDCADHLERALERRLHDLHVVITSKEITTALNHTSLEFRAALQRWQGLRQQLRRKVQELRAHEELMNAPQIDAT